ncbi:MAG: TonB-dependent receptor, partial [Cyclobacteriaceae bacterium]
FNSLDDFYTDANDYLANPGRAVSPVELNLFQVSYAAQPGLTEPVQPLEVVYGGLYAQDEWRATDNLNMTFGLRVDVPFFGQTGFRNPEVETLTFLDENDDVVRYSTDKLPDPNPLWSPRFGFNWDVFGDRSLQVRGGSGVFTGTPAFVWISNQIGNSGVLTGNIEAEETTAYPFNPDPDAYKPEVTEVEVPPSYSLALTNPNFKFPQVWRSSIAVDKTLPFGFIGTAEFIYNRDINGILYINANLPVPEQQFVGPDDRPLYTENRINSQIPNAIVLQNQNNGYAYSATASLERPFANGFFIKAAYNFGEAKNLVDPGSIAAGSWFNNEIVDDPNNPELSFSGNDQRHRAILSGSYRKEYAFGATQVSLFWEGRNIGRSNYIFSGDQNGDGGRGNDLIYIPRDRSEMNFEEYTSRGGVLFTVEDQEEAWEAFIQQDKYLSANRGSYAARNGVILPWVFRADLSLIQEFSINVGGEANTLQLRADILNVGNLINRNWGVGQRLVTGQPLVARGADDDGRSVYRLQNFNDQLITESFQGTNFLSDVYQIQLGVRYIFGE